MEEEESLAQFVLTVHSQALMWFLWSGEHNMVYLGHYWDSTEIKTIKADYKYA